MPQVLHLHGKRTLSEAFAEIDCRRPDRGVRCRSAELHQVARCPGRIRFRRGARRTRREQYRRYSDGTSFGCHDCSSPQTDGETITDRLNDDDDKRHYHKLGLQAQNEPNAEPSAITAVRAMTGPTIAAMTMSK